jgi:hypothetical protein
MMIEKDDIAVGVKKALQDAYRILEDSIWLVNNNCSAAEADVYRQKIGTIFGSIVFDLMEPLYERHPELKPADWDS